MLRKLFTTTDYRLSNFKYDRKQITKNYLNQIHHNDLRKYLRISKNNL